MKFLVITGGSNNIGQKIVERFLAEGWFVINLSDAVLPIFNVTNYKVDFTQPGWEKDILPSIVRRLRLAKQICLVHNASRYITDNTQSIDANEFRKTAEVNIITPLILNHALIPLMPAGSSILYIGSILSEKAIPNAASCVISKHALVGMMRATCQDLIGKGIHTACICPGFKDTKYLKVQLPEVSEKINQLKNKSDQDQAIKLDEVADLIWYCNNHPVVDGAIWHATVDPKEPAE